MRAFSFSAKGKRRRGDSGGGGVCVCGLVGVCVCVGGGECLNIHLRWLFQLNWNLVKILQISFCGFMATGSFVRHFSLSQPPF